MILLVVLLFVNLMKCLLLILLENSEVFICKRYVRYLELLFVIRNLMYMYIFLRSINNNVNMILLLEVGFI